MFSQNPLLSSLLTIGILAISTMVAAQETKNIKVNDFEAFLKRQKVVNGKPLLPRLNLTPKLEVGDVGLLDGGDKRDSESVTVSYTYVLEKRLTEKSGIVNATITTHIPMRPISASGSPGNIQTKFARAETRTAHMVFILEDIDLSLKADGSEVALKGTFYVSKVGQNGEKGPAASTLFVIQPFSKQRVSQP